MDSKREFRMTNCFKSMDSESKFPEWTVEF